MDIRQIRQFLAVAETGSFSAAAEKLYISRPAVSKSMALLEDRIGINLFERGHNRAFLTDAGRTLLPKMRELASAHDRLEAEMLELGGGRRRVRIGFTYGVHMVFLDALSAFEERHPDVKLEISDCSFDRAPQLLKSGELDICCTGADYRDAKLTSVPIRRCEILWGVKAGSDVAARGYILEEELRNRPHCVPKGSTMENILKRGASGELEPDRTPFRYIFDDNMFYLCKLVERGRGIIPIGKDAVPESVKGIVFVPCPEAPSYWEIRAYIPGRSVGKTLRLLLKEVFAPS